MKDYVVYTGTFGLTCIALLGGIGFIRGYRSGEQLNNISFGTTSTIDQESNLHRRYTFPPPFKAHSRVILMNILTGPIIFLGHRVINRLIFEEDDMITFSPSSFVDFLRFLITLSSLSYSFFYTCSASSRTDLTLVLASIRHF